MSDPILTAGIRGFLTVDEHESLDLGLAPRPHGLILVTDAAGVDWVKVTDDLGYFALVVAATLSDPESDEDVLVKRDLFRITLRGWPEGGVGTIPDLPELPC